MNLYIGNFPYTTTIEQLAALFDEFGGYNVKVCKAPGGRPGGFGFVTVDDVVADMAIKKLDGIDFGGRILYVSPARNQPRAKRRTGT
jgi:RNA recognition motif-containing protein